MPVVTFDTVLQRHKGRVNMERDAMLAVLRDTNDRRGGLDFLCDRVCESPLASMVVVRDKRLARLRVDNTRLGHIAASRVSTARYLVAHYERARGAPVVRINDRRITIPLLTNRAGTTILKTARFHLRVDSTKRQSNNLSVVRE